MRLRFVFAGFRHSHIRHLYELARRHDHIEIAGACEDDPETRAALAAEGSIALTHATLADMLREVPCDVVAIGDYYARRGTLARIALEAGRHVISDKPVCTTLGELGHIEALTRSGGLKLGAMLDLRDAGPFITARDMIRRGELGSIQAIAFGGQHPLLAGSRPGWYFEPGKHGGTINDIAIHAIDLIPWICGTGFAWVEAARTWNARAKHCPPFKDAAQMLLTMCNGAGVLGDVSYFVPDSLGYQHPWYWRMTFWGERGILEAAYTRPTVRLARQGDAVPREIACAPRAEGQYLEQFLADVAGAVQPGALDTGTVIAASRTTLAIQAAADQGRCHVPLGDVTT